MQPLGPNDPQRIGPYRLTHVLGSGGMGRVFLGRTPSGRRIAVKVVHSEYMRHAEFRTRFIREVRAAHRVGGFHTAQVVGADTEAERPWIASAYIPGPSLFAVVDEHGPLPEPSLRVLAAGLAEGLLAIHRAGLAHRDLNPANILVDQEGPRIIDFGIALPTEETHITGDGTVLGTPAYMSPEQASADPDLSGPASDVFTYGTVLHYAATGYNPFQAPTVMGCLARLLRTRPVVSPALPDDLAEIVTRCWNREPWQRPALAEVLSSLDGVDPDTAWPPHPGQPMETDPSKQRTVPGVPPTLVVTKHLTRTDSAVQARSLRRRAEEFREVKLHEKARAATAEAVALYRVLAEQAPDTHRVDLADVLQILSVNLYHLERWDEAVSAVSEALDHYRVLVEQAAGNHRNNLALALHNKGLYLARLGRHVESLPYTEAAIILRRDLVKMNPDAQEPELATSLQHLAIDLQELGRSEEALRFNSEAVSLQQALVERMPEHDKNRLAAALATQAWILRKLHRPADALRVTAVEVTLRRELVRQDPDVHTEGLASVLHSQGLDLLTLDLKEDALRSFQEGGQIRRALEAKEPGRHATDLMASLRNQLSVLNELKRTEEAADLNLEAIALARILMDQGEVGLSLLLTQQGSYLTELGRLEEVPPYLTEAVSGYRQLTVQEPRTHKPVLAGVLAFQAAVMGALDRHQ